MKFHFLEKYTATELYKGSDSKHLETKYVPAAEQPVSSHSKTHRLEPVF